MKLNLSYFWIINNHNLTSIVALLIENLKEKILNRFLQLSHTYIASYKLLQRQQSDRVKCISHVTVFWVDSW